MAYRRIQLQRRRVAAVKPTPILVAALLLTGVFAGLVASVDAEIASTWTQEIPGVPEGVGDLQMQGDDDKQGIVYELLTSATLGFLTRNAANDYTIQSTDVSGNATDLEDPDLCYNGGTSWAVIAQPTGTDAVWYYRSSNDGANWTLDFNFNGSPEFHALDCLGTNQAIIGANGTSDLLPFYRSTDSGATWTGGYDLADDDGSPTGTGVLVSSIGLTGDVAWITSTDVVVQYASVGASCRVYETTSDDGGVFWTVPVIVWTSTGCDDRIRGMGVGRIDADNYGTVVATQEPERTVAFYNGDDATEDFFQSGSFDVNTGCGSLPCKFSSNDAGQLLVYSRSSERAYFTDDQATDFSAVTGLVTPGTDINEVTVHLLSTEAFVVWADPLQGDRLEVNVAEVTPPPQSFTFVNPNGNNWGDVRANWDITDREVYLKEREATGDATLGNVFRMDQDLVKITQWDACPTAKLFAGVGQIDSTKDESLSTPGNLGVVPAISTEVYTACLGDFSVTDEFYYLAQFDRFGSFQGYMPINAATAIDDPAYLEPCADNQVWTEHFSQVDPINITLVDTADSHPFQNNHREDRGKIFDVITPDLTAIAVDPLAFTAAPAGFTECRFYRLSSTAGLRAYNEDGQEWLASSATGNGLAAYNGQVWVTNTAGTMVSRYIDLGSSFSLAETEAMTTTIDAFNEQLRVSKDGAYLIAHCAANDVCIYESSSPYDLVHTETVGTVGTMFYDMDISNSLLYVTRLDVAYAFDVSSVTSAFGDPDNCLVEPLPEACEQVETTTTTTTTALGPGGVGGEEGGFVGEPGSGIPGLDVAGVAAEIGISTAALAWILGLLWIIAITVGLGSITLLESGGGSFSVPLAMLGAILGLGSAVALSLVPVWFIIITGLMAAAILVLKLRSGASS